MGVVRTAAVLVALGWAWPAVAGSFERCGRSELKLAEAAVAGAAEVARRAAAAVGDTTDFARWFGPWSPARGEAVRANLKAIHRALGRDELRAVCLPPGSLDCKAGEYAFVLMDRPMEVRLCPSFFLMPSMRDAVAGVGDQANGTREGTIIHELSHFPDVAGTGDACYSRPGCAAMAQRDPRTAVATADSHQYFAEDATVTALTAKAE